MHYAAAHGLLEISEYLITHGANINSQNDVSLFTFAIIDLFTIVIDNKLS